MARLRQQHPQNYVSSGNINTEFESLIRYLNSAEWGNKTVGELLSRIFNDEGEFEGPIEMRKDASSGIQFRVGDYSDPEAGWQQIVTLDEIRGEPGEKIGEIGAPIFHQREDWVVSGTTTTDLEYSHKTTDELVVFKNGVLQREGSLYDYTTDPVGGASGGGAIVFNSALADATVVSAYKVRSTAITGYKRSDIAPPATQIIFPFTFDDGAQIQVYKNGILQREGGSNDYTKSSGANTVNFNSAVTAGELVTIITVENVSSQAVTGIMLETDYADPATGLINYAKLGINDNEIPQVKVDGLATDLQTKAKIFVQSTDPTGTSTVNAGDLWLDQSVTPNQLKYYVGTTWLRTSPETSLETFSVADAGKVVRVNSQGNALTYGEIDLSSAIPITYRGAANGVASLDSTGRLPTIQLPEVVAHQNVFFRIPEAAAGGVQNGHYPIHRVWKQAVRIEAISISSVSGSCVAKLAINTIVQASAGAWNVTASQTDANLSSPITIAATSATSHSIGIEVSSASSCGEIEVMLVVSLLGM